MRQETTDQSGFTLFELLRIMAVGSILLALAVPPVQKTADSYRLRASAELISSELNTARLLAISRGAQYQVSIDGTGVQILDLLDPENPPRTRKELRGGVHFRTVPQTPILFYSRGHARPGTVELENEHGEIFRIDVQFSGQVKLTTGDVAQLEATSTEATH